MMASCSLYASKPVYRVLLFDNLLPWPRFNTIPDIGWENRPRNDVFSVDRDVKFRSTQAVCQLVSVVRRFGVHLSIRLLTMSAASVVGKVSLVVRARCGLWRSRQSALRRRLHNTGTDVTGREKCTQDA